MWGVWLNWVTLTVSWSLVWSQSQKIGDTVSRGLVDAGRFAPGEAVELIVGNGAPQEELSKMDQFLDYLVCLNLKTQDGFKMENFEQLARGEDEATHSRVAVPFGKDVVHKTLSRKNLSKEDIQLLKLAIYHNCYYQILFDDMHLRGTIGKVQKTVPPKHFLFTHLHFDIEWNSGSVIGTNVSTNPLRILDISDDTGAQLEFTYSVKWRHVDTAVEKNVNERLKEQILPWHMDSILEKVKLCSIASSSALAVLFLGFLVSILARVFKNEFFNFTRVQNLAGVHREDHCKWLREDVFQYPRPPNLFCAMLGTQTQFMVLTMTIFFWTMFDLLHPYNRGALLSAGLMLYAVTPSICGYVASSCYRSLGNKVNKQTIGVIGALFFAPLLLLFQYFNLVAGASGSSDELPIGTICTIFALWSLITFSLSLGGSIINQKSELETRVDNENRSGPTQALLLPWFLRSLPHMVVAGFLPFSAFRFEFHPLLTAVWGQQVYILWCFLFIAFCAFMTMAVFIIMGMRYFQLAAHDHRAW